MNAIETLAGDESFVRLRNRRAIPRTLTNLERLKEPFQLESVSERDLAEKEFDKQLDKARASAEKKQKSLLRTKRCHQPNEHSESCSAK